MTHSAASRAAPSQGLTEKAKGASAMLRATRATKPMTASFKIRAMASSIRRRVIFGRARSLVALPAVSASPWPISLGRQIAKAHAGLLFRVKPGWRRNTVRERSASSKP
jgi:hypothetical protein